MSAEPRVQRRARRKGASFLRQSDIAEEAVAALARERKETCRLTEECQALRRQVAELQLVIQDLESEVDTRSREAAEVALQLKLESRRQLFEA